MGAVGGVVGLVCHQSERRSERREASAPGAWAGNEVPGVGEGQGLDRSGVGHLAGEADELGVEGACYGPDRDGDSRERVPVARLGARPHASQRGRQPGGVVVGGAVVGEPLAERVGEGGPERHPVPLVDERGEVGLERGGTVGVDSAAGGALGVGAQARRAGDDRRRGGRPSGRVTARCSASRPPIE